VTEGVPRLGANRQRGIAPFVLEEEYRKIPGGVSRENRVSCSETLGYVLKILDTPRQMYDNFFQIAAGISI
jgi:hypothetical protein